jgi:ATP-dependent helicase/nuclease subunit A
MARTWTDEQKRVIAQNNSNLLVSAAAGSGKTAVMVERIIQRILDEKHPVDIDRIVVVTFTKAAAAQMKERIAAALSSVMLSEKNEKRVVLIRRQLALLENAVICTIDSFCNYILRNYFNTIDLDPSYRIGDEGELKLLMSDVADEVIEEAYSCGDKAFLEFVDGQLPAKSDKRLSEWIISLYTFSQSHPYPEEWLLQCKKWYDITTEDEFENSEVVKFTKEHVKNLLKAAIDEYKDVIEQLADVGGIDKYVPVFRNDLSLFEAAYAADSYGSLREKLQIKFERLANAPKDADEELKERAKELRDRQKKIVGKLSDELLEWSVEDNLAMIESMAPSAKAFIDLVLAFEKRYSERKNEDNILSFSDVEHLALRVLRREALHLRHASYSHYMRKYILMSIRTATWFRSLYSRRYRAEIIFSWWAISSRAYIASGRRIRESFWKNTGPMRRTIRRLIMCLYACTIISEAGLISSMR